MVLKGRIDTASVEDFNREVRDALDDVDAVVIDMKELASITSAGLRSLLTICKCMKSKGGMKLLNVNSVIREIFQFTGFDVIFDIE